MPALTRWLFTLAKARSHDGAHLFFPPYSLPGQQGISETVEIAAFHPQSDFPTLENPTMVYRGSMAAW